jgi:hypothetical protein
MVTLLLLAGAAYVVYEYFFAATAAVSSAAPASSSTPAAQTTGQYVTTAPATGAAPAAVTPTTTSAASPSTLDAYYAAMVKDATANGFSSGTPDQWGYYFNDANGFSAPQPESAGWNRTSNWPTTLTAAQYWAAVSPLVAQQKGISGLGVFGGLAGYIARRSR